MPSHESQRLFEEGVALETAGRYEDALDAYVRAVRSDSTHPDAQYGYANMLSRLGHLRDALDAYDTAISLDQNDEHMWHNKGIVLHRLERFHEALAAYDRANQLNADDLVARQGRAMCLLGLGLNGEAVEECDRILHLEPEDDITHRVRGDALAKLERYKDAIASYRRASEIDPSNAFALRDIGTLLVDIGRLGEALEALDQALEMHPDDSVSCFNRGVALERLGRYDEALGSYDLAVELEPQKANRHRARGKVLARLDSHEGAVDAFLEAMRLGSGDTACYVDLGFSLEELGRWQEALDAYQAALFQDAACAQAEFGRANMLCKLERHDEAVGAYRKAIMLEPNDCALHHNLGLALCRLDNHEEALVAFDHAIKLNREDKTARQGRAACLEHLSSGEDALQSCVRAVESSPADPAAHRMLGDALTTLKRFKEALVSYQHAAELDPSSVDCLRDLGLAHERLRDFGGSLRAYERALELQPTDEVSHRGRGVALCGLERHESAQKAFDRAVELDPEYGSGHESRAVELVHLADRYNNKDTFREALKACDRCLELIAPSKTLLRVRGDALLGTDRFQEALDSYDQAAIVDPANAEIQVDRAITFERMGQYKDSLEATTRALQLDSSSLSAYRTLGRIRAALDEHGGALDAFDLALGIAPHDEYSHYGRGTALNQLGRFHEALVSFDRAIESSPTHSPALRGRATALQELGRTEEAAETMQRAVAIDRKSPLDFLLGGLELAGRGRLREAVDALDQAIGVSPGFGPARILRGDLLLKSGLPDEAMADFVAADDPERQANAWVLMAVENFNWFSDTGLSNARRLFEDTSRNAIAAFECARGRLRFLIQRRELMEEWSRRWLELVRLAVSCQLDRLVWDLAQTIKARTFLEEGASHALWLGLLKHCPDLAAAQKRLEELKLGETSPDRSRELLEAEVDFRRLLDKAAREHPEMTLVTSVEPATKDQLVGCLHPGEAYLDYLWLDDGMIRLTLTFGRESVVEIIEKDSFHWLEDWLTRAEEKHAAFGDWHELQDVHRSMDLLGVIPSGTSSLLISPHGRLLKVPFHSLFYRELSGEQCQLGVRFTTSLVPAAGMLVESRMNRSGLRETPLAYVGLASNSDGRIPGVDFEIRHVRERYFTRLPAMAFLTSDAREFLTTKTSTRLLHLACHASRYGLRLSTDSRWITPVDLIDLGIRADVVVCTGCSVGGFTDEETNEFMGIIRQLIAVTHARAAVVSMDPVPDAAGIVFADLFFAELTGSAPACGRLHNRPDRPRSVGEAVAEGRTRMATLGKHDVEQLLRVLPQFQSAIRDDQSDQPLLVALDPGDSSWREPWVVVGDPKASL
jgi:tetratricopeptide (TPR) repeat protein